MSYHFPDGASMGLGQHALTYEEALKLTEGAPDVHRVLAENAPKRKPGPKPKSGEELKSSSTLSRMTQTGPGKAVLSVRLAQILQWYYDAYLRNDYKTLTAAATAAGLLNDDVNLR